jgi:hypothetical protein
MMDDGVVNEHRRTSINLNQHRNVSHRRNADEARDRNSFFSDLNVILIFPWPVGSDES